MTINSDNVANKEQRAVNGLYITLGITLVAGFVPTAGAAVFSLVLFTVVLIASYVYRGRADAGSLLENHSRYIIRTIWLTSFLAAITTTLASFYMLGKIDSTPMFACMDQVVNMSTSGSMMVIELNSIQAIIQPCMEQYMRSNSSLFMTAGAIAIAPVVLYLILRFIRGFNLGVRGIKITNVKRWL